MALGWKLNGEICDSDRDILQKYMEIGGFIFIVLDRSGRVVSMNQSLCDLLGRNVADIRGEDWFDNFVAPSNRKRVRQVFKSLMAGDVKASSAVVENSILDAAGNERVILWHNALIEDKNGNIYGTISSGMDITEHVKVQQEQSLVIGILKLLNSADSKVDLIGEILKYISEHSGFESVAIRLKDGDDYPYYHSIGFSEQFLVDEQTLCESGLSKENCESGPVCICGSIIEGKTKGCNLPMFTPKGTFWTNNLADLCEHEGDVIKKLVGFSRNRCCHEGYMSMALIPIRIGDEVIGLMHLGSKTPGRLKNGDVRFYENVVESVGIAIHRMGIEEEMKKAKSKIEQINGQLEQFAYKASHDLREPLRTITFHAEMLEDSLKDEISEKNMEYIGKILQGTKLLDRFIDDLLSYSKIGAITELETVNLKEVCIAIRENLESLLEETNGKITQRNLPIIKANKMLITQLLQNLISNSLKYRKEDEPPKISITSRDDGDFWTIMVRDNGIGIAEENKQIIFNMFMRIVPNKYEGTGMGLAICKKIAETLGGKIWVESKLGEGSVFCFTINK